MPQPSTPRAATESDIDSLVSLARTVEPLFGPMPDIADNFLRGIHRGTALVIGKIGQVEAGILLSRDDSPHKFNWLATDPASRGKGYGAALVEAGIDRWPTGDITVITFTKGEPDGEAARPSTSDLDSSTKDGPPLLPTAANETSIVWHVHRTQRSR